MKSNKPQARWKTSNKVEVYLPNDIAEIVRRNCPDGSKTGEFIKNLILKALEIDIKTLKSLKKTEPDTYESELTRLAQMLGTRNDGMK